MSLERLNLQTIAKLDRGRAQVAFDMALSKAVKDCIDRPTDKRARKILMQISVVPVVEFDDLNQATCEGAKSEYLIRMKIPDWQSNTIDFGVRQNGMLVFDEDNPQNHKQGSLFAGGDETDETAEIRGVERDVHDV